MATAAHSDKTEDYESDVSSISCGSFDTPSGAIRRGSLITNAASKDVSMNSDQMAKMISEHMQEKKVSDAIAQALAERVSTIQIIKHFGRHLPKCVLEQFGNRILTNRYGENVPLSVNVENGSSKNDSSAGVTAEITEESEQENNAKYEGLMRLPHAENYTCALLFIDISGFTALSTALDPETLSVVINSYFQMIVDLVISHGGDILKFAGDALFAEWRVTEEVQIANCGARRKEQTGKIDQCVADAAICGAAVVAKCSDYPVYRKIGIAGQETQVTSLNVHCGIGVGKMTGIQVGDNVNRNEYLIIGNPIDQLAEADKFAALGDFLASPEAVAILRKTCSITAPPNRNKKAPLKIASRRIKYFLPRRKKKEKRQYTNTVESLVKICEKHMKTDDLQKLQKQISLYVHPVIVKHEQSKLGTLQDHENRLLPERHRADAELRSVYTIFIKPMIKPNEVIIDGEGQKLYQDLNEILRIVTEVLDKFVGHLRQFIIDDKGVVLIGTFGLRGSTTPNMVAERALPATRLIHQLLKKELGIDNKIGATYGKAYCGVVGGIHRHEFAVLGPSVNLAARLMAQPNHPGILVDDTVRVKSGQAFKFRSLKAVKAKGYADPVPVFEPLNGKESRWGKLNPLFVGRKSEVNTMCKLASEMASKRGPAKMVFVWGDSGSGKSAVIVQAIAVMSKLAMRSKKNILVSRNISNEGDSLVPYSVLRHVFQDALMELETKVDDASTKMDGASQACLSFLEKDWDKMSLSSSGTGKTDRAKSLDRLKYLCEEQNAPQGFLEIVGHHLLGHYDSKELGGKVAKLEDIEKFMAQAFRRCTRHLDLVVLALDDVQYMDNKSWTVLKSIFDSCDNVLFVFGSRPLSSNKLEIEPKFWEEINGIHKEKKRVIETNISSLEHQYIVKLMSKSLQCKPSEIDSQFGSIVYDQSGGMPYFASEILDQLKRERKCKRFKNGKIGLDKKSLQMLRFTKIDELILYRFDSTNENIRQILHIAAVLDTTFYAWEVILVYKHLNNIPNSKKDAVADMVIEALDKAVKEGMLEESFDDEDGTDGYNLDGSRHSSNKSGGGAPQDEMENMNIELENAYQQQYRFFHDTWKRNVNSVLLDSRKQDLHRYAATAMEILYASKEKEDYRSKLKIFRHWKACGNVSKSAHLAHEIGKSFVGLGLSRDAIRMYDDAINMWRRNEKNEEEDSDEEIIGGFSTEVLDSLEMDAIKWLIILHIAKGQAHGNKLEAKQGATSFQNGLAILRHAPASNEIEDRSISFPLFSGLFFLLKFGIVVKAGEEAAFEKELIANFVSETKRHGDPVHYARALAMQVEIYTRVGEFDTALASYRILEREYDFVKHSAAMCEAYGSDRAAQSIAMCATCYLLKDDIQNALRVANEVVQVILPRMDLKNVHNSFITIYSSLWIMLHRGAPEAGRNAFLKFVVEPFDLYFGESGKTPCLGYFKPISMLFDLFIHKGDGSSFDHLEEYIEWMRDEENYTRLSPGLNRSMLKFGRCRYSIWAELSLLISQMTADNDIRKEFINKGYDNARQCVELAIGKDGEERQLLSYHIIKPLYTDLQMLYEGLEKEGEKGKIDETSSVTT